MGAYLFFINLVALLHSYTYLHLDLLVKVFHVSDDHQSLIFITSILT